MKLPFFFDELLVVIVLYKRKPAESAAYTSVRTALKNFPASPEIFLYDNGPVSTDINGDSVTYFHDPSNSGVSKAYNCASVHAQGTGKVWLLFLDQDTSVTMDFFSSLAKGVTAHAESVAFVPRMMDEKGMLSPFRFSHGRGKRILNIPETLSLDQYRFINSGLLIRLSAVVAAGGYNPQIPLDFSDIDFGSRLKKVTDHFRIIDAPLRHAFSDNNDNADAGLARFGFFCRGAMVMGKESNQLFGYLIYAFLRACHLSFRHKDFRFIREFFDRIHG
jgi:rhamnosyltransferase